MNIIMIFHSLYFSSSPPTPIYDPLHTHLHSPAFTTHSPPAFTCIHPHSLTFTTHLPAFTTHLPAFTTHSLTFTTHSLAFTPIHPHSPIVHHLHSPAITTHPLVEHVVIDSGLGVCFEVIRHQHDWTVHVR